MATSEPNREEVKTTPLHEVDFLKNFPVKQNEPPKMILFLGDEQIGKTEFIRKYCEDEETFHLCNGYSDRTLVVTQFLLCHPFIKDRIVTRLVDLKPLESRQLHYPPKVDVVVFCFAVDKPSSLDNILKVWIPEAKQHYPELQCSYLLGLRKDLRKTENGTMDIAEEAHRISKLHKFSGAYMECSVLENRQEAVDLLGKLIQELNRPETPAVLN